MKLTQILAQRCCGAVLLLLLAIPAVSQEHNIDLSPWGYTRPPSPPFPRGYSPVISVGPGGRIAAAFVTGERNRLATDQHPPLSFHIIQFSHEGSFLDQQVLPTSTWTENAVLFTATGNLLVRTGDKLRLFSTSMKLLVEKDVKLSSGSPVTSWKIFPTPDRSAFLLYHFGGKSSTVQLLNSNDLEPVKSCPVSPLGHLTSVSNRNISSFSPTPGSDPTLRAITVSAICGDIQYRYSWHDGPVGATLVGDDAVILAGLSPLIEFVGEAGTKVLWQTTFDQRHELAMEHVEAGADGKILVVAVKRFAGGSEFFDISRHLKS